jgi:hypothetical protein
MLAFDASSARSVVELAKSVLDMAEKNHDAAVDMTMAVREAIISMSVAMALVSHLQDFENPIIVASSEEEESGVAHGHSPNELLQSLSATEDTETFERIVAEFKKAYAEEKADREIRKMPGEFTVSDILGETEGDTKH